MVHDQQLCLSESAPRSTPPWAIFPSMVSGQGGGGGCSVLDKFRRLHSFGLPKFGSVSGSAGATFFDGIVLGVQIGLVGTALGTGRGWGVGGTLLMVAAVGRSASR